jgi:hypothetical protein
VRGPAGLAAMPEPERKQWEMFWAEVEQVLKTVK